MIKPNTPEGRFYLFCQELRANNKGESIKKVFAQALGYPEADMQAIYSQVVCLSELLNKMEGRIKSSPQLTQPIFLQCFPSLRKLISPANWDVGWDQHKMQFLGDSIFSQLQFVVEYLDRSATEAEISEVELKKLQSDIEKLLEKILKMEMGPELKIALVDLLDSARRAIFSYRFRGAFSLREDIEMLAIKCKRHQDVIKSNPGSPESASVWDILSRLDSLSSIAVNLPQITAGAQTLIGWIPC